MRRRVLWRFIWDYTVCSDLSVRILTVYTLHIFGSTVLGKSNPVKKKLKKIAVSVWLRLFVIVDYVALSFELAIRVSSVRTRLCSKKVLSSYSIYLAMSKADRRAWLQIAAWSFHRNKSVKYMQKHTSLAQYNWYMLNGCKPQNITTNSNENYIC